MSDSTASAFPDPLRELRGSPGRVRFAAWWLVDGAASHFVYAQIVPCRVSRRAEWGKRSVKSVGPLQLIRRTLDLDAPTAFDLVTRLQTGATLSECCAQLGLPDHQVESDTLRIDSSWTLFAPSFFSPVASQSQLAAESRGRSSLTSYAGAFCTRLAPAERFRFLGRVDRKDDALEWLTSELTRESGVGFAHGAGDAFGSIEIFSMPCLDAREHSNVSVSFDNKGSAECLVRIEIEESGSGKYVAQVRATHANDICFDQLVHLDDRTAVVVVPEPFCGALVRVWRQDSRGRFVLRDETEHHFLREIHVAMQLQGLSGEIAGSWFDRLPKRARSRAAAFAKITQVSHDMPLVVSHRPKSEKELVAARAAVRRAIPPRSGAKFFSSGWVSSNESTLDFALWLKEVLSSRSGKIVLTDPYFDLAGLDLISRASGAASEFVVLTSTKLRSDDDSSDGVTRAERLRRAAENHLHIFRGLHLRILDLRPKSQEQRVFHDRYLLQFDKDWRIEGGFHLSTSLQTTAGKSPMLVTPIPPDVLDEVADYVTGLFDGSDPNVDRVTLFPSDLLSPVRHGSLSPRTARSVLALALRLRGSESHDETPDSDAVSELRKLGVYDGEKVRLGLVAGQLERATAWIGEETLEVAASLWDGLVHAGLADWYDGMPPFTAIAFAERDDRMERFLCEYIEAHGTGVLVADGWETHTRTLSHAIDAMPFSKALGNASSFYDHFHSAPIGTSWPIHVALMSLVKFYPLAIDRLIDRLTLLDAEAERQLSRRAPTLTLDDARRLTRTRIGLSAVRSAVVGVLAEAAQGHCVVFPQELRSSSNPFVRALGIVSLWRRACVDDASWKGAWADFDQALTALDRGEQQEALARAIYDVRIRHNQEAPDWPVRHAVFESFLESLGPKTTPERIVELAPFLSGPLRGDHALLMYEEVLAPLVKRGCISPSEAFEVLNQLLDERMQGDDFARGDPELVEVWACALWNAEGERRGDVLSSIASRFERAQRALYEPFLRSRDYARWSAAQRATMWCLFQVSGLQRQMIASPVEQGNQSAVIELDALAEAVVAFVRKEELAYSSVGLAREYALRTLDAGQVR